MQTIPLPIGYSFPYDVKDADLNAYIIELGFKVYQFNKKYQDTINKAKYSFIQTELKDEYEEALKICQQKYEENINTLLDRTKLLQNKISETEQVVEEKNNIIKVKQIQFETRVDKLDEEYKNKFALAREEINSMCIAQSTREKEIRTEIEKTYQDTIAIERERWNSLNAQHTLLSSALANRSTTVSIGNIGEETITNWIREIFNTADITDTSGLTAKGDLHVKIQNKILLIEVKNKINIQKTDIDKFFRDVENNISDIHGGLFISLGTSSIPNKGDFSLEYISDIPVIYLHVPDRQTLKVAIKSLLFLNNKTDNTLLSMIINQIYGNLKYVSSLTVSMSKNLDDSKVSLDSLKREVKKAITQLDQLFDENPDIKIDSTSQDIEFTQDEIKKIREVNSINKKAKMADYISALNVNAKYLQDRGGAARIKNICSLQSFKLNLTSLS